MALPLGMFCYSATRCAGVGQLASPLQAALISFSQLHNVFSCQAPAKLSSLTPGAQVSVLSYATWLMPSWLKVPRDCCSVSSLNRVPIKAPTVFPRLALIAALHVRTASRTSRIRRPRELALSPQVLLSLISLGESFSKIDKWPG